MFKHRIVFLLLLLPIVCFLDLWWGSIYIPFNELINILSGNEADEGFRQIVLNYRLPRVLTALGAGLGLSLSGLMMQTYFRNPLAGPFILGISSGASLGVAIVVLAGGAFILTQGPLLVIAAFFGSALVFGIILLASLHIKQSTTLLIVGIMVGSATSAIISILQYFSNAEQIEMYLLWTFGTLGSVDWQEMNIYLPIVVTASILVFFLAKPLNTLLLGEHYAHSLGVNVKRTQVLILVLTSILAGTITTYCGPIAFIGLAVPHIARWVFGTSDHKTLIIGSALSGMIILVICDILSQWPGSGSMLPINAITSLIGIPVVLALIFSRKTITTA
ncbi:MAG: FecCD family ABC transporter permease [Candidatus Cyclobacteriaceae bacterium M2_1C_046]